MTNYEYYIVYPEGEVQEIPGPLRIDQLVDVNGSPLRLPLASPRLIAYRVVKVRKAEARGEAVAYHHLELVPAAELVGFCR